MRGRVSFRKLSVVLFLAVLAVTVGSSMLTPASAASFFPRFLKSGCYYASALYSYNACRGGQRCLRDLQGEYYWSDDSACSNGGGGVWDRPVV